MSDPEKQPKVEDRPESPTTARALDFDDDTTETPASPHKADVPSKTTTTPPNPGSGEELAPPKPPRPLAPEQQAEATLMEAFPSIDATVVKAVLRASGGQLEPAFNALLGMSDPDAAEPSPPAQPPRPQQSYSQQSLSTESQMAADERYARQLAEHYNRAPTSDAPPNSGPGFRRDARGGRPPREAGPGRNQLDDERERSFIDDDLPVIRDNIKKGFLETQSTVNKWVNSLKKKIDGDDEDSFLGRPSAAAQGYVPQQQYNTRRSSEFGRRSADQERYDADPQVLGDDFTGLQLRDSEEPQRRSNRPLANPDLFKPTPPRPQSSQSGSGRRVSFQSGPPEEIDIHYPISPDPIGQPSSGTGKPSKWQPLAAVDPSPVADHDPFSLGDSDDEDAKKKDIKAEDSDRLKKAASEAMSEGISSPKEKTLEPQERTGSLAQKDAETEKLVG